MSYLNDYVDQLEEDHPAWHVWWVPRATGGFHWCAQRWDRTADPVSRDSPAQLDEALARAESRENP